MSHLCDSHPDANLISMLTFCLVGISCLVQQCSCSRFIADGDRLVFSLSVAQMVVQCLALCT